MYETCLRSCFFLFRPRAVYWNVHPKRFYTVCHDRSQHHAVLFSVFSVNFGRESRGEDNEKKSRIFQLPRFIIIGKDYALSTLPDLRQEVQTYIFLAAPFTFTLTDLIFDFHILFDLLCE